jgi:RIO-like serine/threonine protein kinase
MVPLEIRENDRIGRNIPSLLTGTMDKVIYVLMLQVVDGLQLEHVEPSKKVALAIMASLCRIHNLGVVHGDISKSNVLILGEAHNPQALWLDFASSWTNASEPQQKWERENALQYFSDWVSVNRSF